MKSQEISKTKKNFAITYFTLNGDLNLDEVQNYLKEYHNKESTEYRRILCAFDYIKYGDI